MSDSTPTTPLSTSATPPVEGSSRRLMIILISVAGALLLGIIILLVVLFGRGSGDPVVVPTETESASASPSPTPTVTETSATPTPEVTESEEAAPPPPPPPTGPIESFSVSKTTVNCEGASSVPLHFEWSANGLGLWFGVGVNDAKAAPYGQYELTDELDIDYQCGQSNKQQKYTITVQPAEGDVVSQSIIIKE